MQKTWEETDKLVEENNLGQVDRSARAWIKAIMLLMAGIVILSVLAEPLIHSVQSFSTAANISSFFIAFILVPLATNARAASSAITAARRRKPRTTSLTFSEVCSPLLHLTFHVISLGSCLLLSRKFHKFLPYAHYLITCHISSSHIFYRKNQEELVLQTIDFGNY